MPVTANALCLDCNYPLRALSDRRCPECGRPFDPADPKTMNMGSPITGLVLWLLGPVSLPTRLFLASAALVTLWMARLPGAQNKVESQGQLAWSAIAILWALVPITRALIARKNNWRRSHLKLGRRRFTGLLAMIALIAALHCHLPLKATLRFSRPAMDALARHITTDPNPDYAARWVGLYPAKNPRKILGGMKFTVEDSDVNYKAGFVYLPTVNPRRVSWKTYRYVGDGWWAWREEG